MNTLAIQELIKSRLTLVSEKDKMIAQFDGQINDLEKAIETLSGERAWEMPVNSVRYDDESPDYIKSSIED